MAKVRNEMVKVCGGIRGKMKVSEILIRVPPAPSLPQVIKKKLVRKALDMFKKMDVEDYKKFWEQFSTNIKLGVMEDTSNKTRLAKLLRWGHTSVE